MSFLSKLARAIGVHFEPASPSPTIEAPSASPILTDCDGHADPDRSPPPLAEGVTLAADGRYQACGYRFATERQASEFHKRMNRPLRPIPRTAPANTTPEPSRREAGATTLNESQGDARTPHDRIGPSPDGVAATADGRFRAGGYSFSTEHQARHFLARKSRRATTPAAVQPGPQSARPAEAGPVARLDRADASVSPTGRTPSSSKGHPVRWVADPSSETIGGVRLDAYLVYIGARDSHAHPIGQSAINQSAIDPARPVGGKDDPEGNTLSWNPDYCFMSPEARRSYLIWLAAGRPGGAAIGYVKLYVSGLERRLLLDRANEDAPAILAELRRLLGLYGDHHDFGPRARKLLDVAALATGQELPQPKPALSLRDGFELPLGLLVQLGERVGAGQALDADIALCWLLATPTTWPRTPVTRCFDEFVALWRIRFAIAYPAGLKVRTPRARIAYRYQSTSGLHADLILKDVPDLSGTHAPVVRLHELMTQCSDALSSYSRFVGSDEAVRGSLAAAMLLPPELAESAFGRPLAAARTEVLRLAHDGQACPADAVLAAVGLPAATAPLSAAQQRQLAQRLDMLGIGFEPDRRYGAAGPLRGDTPLALFEARGGGPIDADDPIYPTARLLLDIGVLAAAADGCIVPAEIEAIAAQVRLHPDLSYMARTRLLAALRVIPNDQPKLSAALKRLCAVPPAGRRDVAMAATAAVLADGQILPAEVRFLEKLFDTLELTRDALYSLLHRGEADEPVAVMPARPEVGVALPHAAPSGTLVIDAERLARIRSETSDVSRLLASIFVEDAPAAPAAQPIMTESRFAGLDASHAALLEGLIHAPMPRDSFESAARQARLMSDGAIETINDWGFDRFDESVIEDGDTLFIPAHLLTQLQQPDP